MDKEETISITSMIKAVAIKVTEDAEKFVFETIKPYCEEITKREISKKDLERALTQYFSKEREIKYWVDHDGHVTPIVQPSRKGHWIHREDMDYLDENGVTNTHLMCEDCGFIHNFKDNHTAQYNFCPNCGADMESEDD